MSFVLENIRRIFSSPVSSAFLLALSFEHPALSVLAFFGLVPFLLFIFGEPNKKRIFRKSWFVGSLYFAIVLRWFLAAFPAEWAGIDNPTIGLVLVLFVWLGSSAVLGLSFALFGLAAANILRKNFLDVFILPALWITSQYIGAWSFSFWSWGPEATLGPHWTFGNIGYALVSTPLAFWSRMGGLYILDFFAAFFNTALALWFLKRSEFFEFIRSHLYKSVFAVVFLAAIILYPKIHYSFFYEETGNSKDPVYAALLQTNYGTFYNNALGELFEDKRKSGQLSRQPDLLIFSENFRLLSYVNEAEELLLTKIFPDQNQPGLVVTGTSGPDESGGVNQRRKNFIIFRNQKGDLLDRQEKNFLIPTGEFMPELLGILLEFSGEDDLIYAFNDPRGLARGVGAERPVDFGGYSVGVLACSGVISPPLYRNLARNGASILVNSASHGVFRGSPAAFAQIRSWARFQAIANAKPFLQASNGGLSYAIDADGRIIKETHTPGVELLVVEIRPNNAKTPYTKFGDWPILTGLLGILAAGFLGRRRFGDKNALST